MAAPSTTVWDLEPHTRAKHEILRRYLQAWTPILTQGGFPELAYIDGFAGPGRYSKGEDGSPIIALKNAINVVQRQNSSAKILFLFVELDQKRADVLNDIVGSIPRPEDRIRVRVAGAETFEGAFANFLGFYEKKGKKLPPTFAFIDPFGWKGVSFEVVKRILSFPSCEVLINFMYEEINRFVAHQDQVQNFDEFFGSGDWRAANELKDPRARNRFLHDLYARQLRTAAGAKYVRSFQMRNDRDVTDYYLFHATNSIRGLEKMKEAMWKVDDSGEFTFSDATDPNQFVLFEKAPRFDLLRKQILERFAGKEASVGNVESFVVADTAFRETHYKAQLKAMEADGVVTVLDAPPTRRRGTFPDPKMRLAFGSE